MIPMMTCPQRARRTQTRTLTRNHTSRLSQQTASATRPRPEQTCLTHCARFWITTPTPSTPSQSNQLDMAGVLTVHVRSFIKSVSKPEQRGARTRNKPRMPLIRGVVAGHTYPAGPAGSAQVLHRFAQRLQMMGNRIWKRHAAGQPRHSGAQRLRVCSSSFLATLPWRAALYTCTSDETSTTLQATRSQDATAQKAGLEPLPLFLSAG